MSDPDLAPYLEQIELYVARTIAKLTDTLAGSTQPPKPNPSHPAPISGPTRCRNCNRPFRGFCRKCAGSYNIKTQGRTRK